MRYLQPIYESDESSDIAKILSDLRDEISKNRNIIIKDVKNLAKDTDLDETNVKEEVIIGAILSTGVILELVGKFMKYTGKKMSADEKAAIMTVGENIEKYGHTVHKALLSLIDLILTPLIFWVEPEKRKHISNIMFVIILAIKVIHTGFSLKDISSPIKFTENLLSTIKVGEITSFIRKYGHDFVKLIIKA